MLHLSGSVVVAGSLRPLVCIIVGVAIVALRRVVVAPILTALGSPTVPVPGIALPIEAGTLGGERVCTGAVGQVGPGTRERFVTAVARAVQRASRGPAGQNLGLGSTAVGLTILPTL